jgi:hypothetical protein
MNRRIFLNWLGLGFFATTFPEITSIIWDNNQLLSEAIASESVPTTAEVIEKIKNICLPSLGKIYHRSNDQDREGVGIFPCDQVWGCDSESPCKEPDNRSETIYLPFVMAPRRQTDSMIRQSYFLLPENVRKKTAFLIADRLVQYPEAYLPYIKNKENVVLIGSFQGITENVKDKNSYQTNEKLDWLRDLHKLQLQQLDYSIDLIKSLNKNIVDVVYAMGDSPYPYAKIAREDMTRKFNEILVDKKLDTFILKNEMLAWGADETILKAFARQLPDIKLKIEISNAYAKQHYEQGEKAQNLVNNAIKNLKISEVKGDNFDAQVLIFTWYSKSDDGFTSEEDAIYKKNSDQEKSDKPLIIKMENLSSDIQKKTIVIDARKPNGAWDTSTIPTSDKFLAFGSWGTFANSLVQTLSIAKLLHFYDQPDKLAIQRQLFLEAISHDAFLIGYKEGRGTLQQALKDQNLTYSGFDNYDSDKTTQKVFQVINEVVNERIKSDNREVTLNLKDTNFIFVPQLWRTSESAVYMNNGPLSKAGVYRKDLPPETFNPTIAARKVKLFNREDLINEFSQ